MPSDTTRALYRLGRELRYRKLPVIGQSLRITSLAEVEPVLRQLVAPWVTADAPWDGCELLGGLAKYGLLDRWFTAPAALLDDPSTLVGAAALRENGLGGQREPDEDPELEEMTAAAEAGCLVDLATDLDAGTCLLKLFLEDDLPGEQHSKHLIESYRATGELSLPANYFPRAFVVTDACVTNASGIWFGKHFYL
jgi:hypothetical protein